MKKFVNFGKYAAAVEIATLASKGDGELNEFDHVAKDLHKEGFLELFDETPDWMRNYYRNVYEDEIWSLTLKRYKDEPRP